MVQIGIGADIRVSFIRRLKVEYVILIRKAEVFYLNVLIHIADNVSVLVKFLN